MISWILSVSLTADVRFLQSQSVGYIAGIQHYLIIASFGTWVLNATYLTSLRHRQLD